jgi:hypothetical protein
MRPTRLMLAGACLLSACSANWQPLTVPQSRPLDKGTVVEFHAKDQLVRLHGVVFSRDSVSGIPWLDHLGCDTCRVSYAVADLSGLRTGNPGAGAWVLLTPFIVVMALGVAVGIAWSASGSGN